MLNFNKVFKEPREGPDGGAIVHDNFVYVQGLQRCATNSTRAYIWNLYNAGKLPGTMYQYKCRGHMPIRLCKKDSIIKKLKIGNIRNPYDFYISFYNFHYNTMPRSGFKGYFDSKISNASFKDFLYLALFKLNWQKFANELDSRSYFDEQTWSAKNTLNVGLYTKRYINLFFNNAVNIINSWSIDKLIELHDEEFSMDIMCQVETLTNDINRIFNISDNSEMVVVNASNHNEYNYSDYYDNESSEWVKTQDGLILNRYNYAYNDV